jgi:hypothetical protein
VSHHVNWYDFSKRWHDIDDIQHWRSLYVINGAWAILVGLMLLRIWVQQRSSYASNLLLHWTLFAWLAWYAFPAAELP